MWWIAGNNVVFFRKLWLQESVRLNGQRIGYLFQLINAYGIQPAFDQADVSTVNFGQTSQILLRKALFLSDPSEIVG